MIWSFILAFFGLLGLYLAGQNNYWGWLIGAATQLLWIVYATYTKQYGFYLTALAYAGVYLNNFVKWRKKELANG